MPPSGPLAWRFFQVDWNVRLENFGKGALRWTPSTSSNAERTTRLWNAKFAIGENRTPIVPTRSVWARPQSRSLGILPSRSRPRAWLFISAIFTPAGQTVVHQPQPLQ